jgi:RpiR family carbohydrate utilization transcriptional regulator
MNYQNLLSSINVTFDSLNKSEKKVAGAILDDPEAATRSSIAILAKKAGVSEPSVNRFCKRFGTAGFPDFKLKLAQCLVSGVKFVNSNVQLNDNVSKYTPKIFDNAIHDLVAIKNQIDSSIIEKVVDQLLKARRIFFFGLGTSGAVARDAENKFFRFDLPVSFHVDVLTMRMLSAAAKPGDLFFMISHTGRTKAIIDATDDARENGAIVVGLTTPGSMLAKKSHFAIEVLVSENTEEYMAMTSRIVHLVILDVLATGFILSKGPEFLNHMEKINLSLKPTRYKQ